MFRRRRRSAPDGVERYADALIEYGQRSLLGPNVFAPTGIDRSHIETRPLRQEIDSGDKAATVSALCDLAEARGGWVAVGVWRFLHWDYDAEYETTASRALDASVRAIVDDLGLRNAYWFMERAERYRYEDLFGGPPPRGSGDTGVPDFGGPIPDFRG